VRGRVTVIALLSAVTATACATEAPTELTISMEELAATDASAVLEGTSPAPAGEASATAREAAIAAPEVSTTGPPQESAAFGSGPAISAGTATAAPTGTSAPQPDPAGTKNDSGEPTPAARDYSNMAMGRGVTEETISIGVHTSTDLQAAFSAVGANASAVDERAVSQAVIDWINERGGIAGRRIVPVFHETNPASGDFAAQAQAACATFTEDNEVFAVSSSTVGGNDAMLACLSERATPLIENNVWIFDRYYYERSPGLLYQPSRMVGDRWVVAWLDGLEELGYLAEGRDGLGLLRFNGGVFDRLADGILKPHLASLGYELTDEVRISTPKGVSDFGAMANELNSAVLRMRSKGVTHVMMLENNGIIAFFFLDQAESQGYRPRYGFNSMDVPQVIQKQNGPEQLTGAVVSGWMPTSDYATADHPGGNDAWTRCAAIMEGAGIEPVGYYVHPRCDSFFFLKEALEAGPELTTAGLRAGAEVLGDRFVSAVAVNGLTRFGPGLYDGPNAMLPGAYDLDCRCFRVIGPARSL
jgi:hypothetical protein